MGLGEVGGGATTRTPEISETEPAELAPGAAPVAVAVSVTVSPEVALFGTETCAANSVV